MFPDKLNKTNLRLPNLSVKLSSSLPVINCASLSLLIASMMFQYFVKVVPTVYMKVDGEVSTFFPLLLWQGKAFRLSPQFWRWPYLTSGGSDTSCFEFSSDNHPSKNNSIDGVTLSVMLQQWWSRFRSPPSHLDQSDHAVFIVFPQEKSKQQGDPKNVLWRITQDQLVSDLKTPLASKRAWLDFQPCFQNMSFFWDR